MLLPLVFLAVTQLTTVEQDYQVPLEYKLRLLEVINQDRRQAGVPPVEFSAELSRAADAHCREMLREGYSGHWNRAGWKPYLRYSQAGIWDATEENVSSRWETSFPTGIEAVWAKLVTAHQGFMAEAPPYDGHRRSVLGRHHTHVGIGAAYDAHGLRLIEVFSVRVVQFEPLPFHADLRARVEIRGRVLRPELRVAAISVFYEPLPQPMTVEQLRATSSYSFPKEELVERLELAGNRMYVDGTRGDIRLGPRGRFSAPLRLWKRRPGIYSAAIWVSASGAEPYIGASISLLVQESPRSGLTGDHRDRRVVPNSRCVGFGSPATDGHVDTADVPVTIRKIRS